VRGIAYTTHGLSPYSSPGRWGDWNLDILRAGLNRTHYRTLHRSERRRRLGGQGGSLPGALRSLGRDRFGAETARDDLLGRIASMLRGLASS
jgi:hypothetical protein